MGSHTGVDHYNDLGADTCDYDLGPRDRPGGCRWLEKQCSSAPSSDWLEERHGSRQMALIR